MASFSKPTIAMSEGCVSAKLRLLLHLAFTFDFQTFFGLVLVKSLLSGSEKIRFSSFHLIVGLVVCNQGIFSIRL